MPRTRKELVADIERMMRSGEPFTYDELGSSLPPAEHENEPNRFALADRTIQRWRKKGWISHVRVGKRPIWSLTELGREMVKQHA